MLCRLSVAALSLLALACATPKTTPINAPVLVPGAKESVTIDQLVVLVDSSSSVSARSEFPEEKALVEAFARSMPAGEYETGAITFGGFRRDTDPLATFERSRVVANAATLPHLAEGTPIHRAIAEAAAELEGKSGQAAIVLYSDGELTDEVGRELDPQLAFDAAAQLRDGYPGKVCFHTVQVGSSPDGAAFLKRLANTTECGSFRHADAVGGVASLHQFEREVLLGGLPAVAAAPRDLDGDGVTDADDLCPGSPRGSAVDERGCWVVRGLLFATDSFSINAAGKKGLDEVARVLRENPTLRVRIEGHTDAQGADAYNHALSDRRADAARSYLVSAGVSKSRLETKGFGEGKPAADNATAQGRQMNRRTEITVIR